jgi:hypothetical protein
MLIDPNAMHEFAGFRIDLLVNRFIGCTVINRTACQVYFPEKRKQHRCLIWDYKFKPMKKYANGIREFFFCNFTFAA